MLYFVGQLFGRERLEHLADQAAGSSFSASDLARGEVFFARHGNKIVLLGGSSRWSAASCRSPAGIERMPIARFVALTAIGSSIWNAIFIGLGYAAGDHWDQIEQYVQPFSYLALLVLALLAGWLVVPPLPGRRPDGGPGRAWSPSSRPSWSRPASKLPATPASTRP